MIEIRQLKYFSRVAELEHYGQAAADLHIVQPALTRQIKQLEEELGVQLFERLPRGVRLTPAGKVLLEKSRLLLQSLDRLVYSTRQAASGKTGAIRVGFADGATYSGHLATYVRDFRKRFEHVDVELIHSSSLKQWELLANNAIDLGFVYWLPKNREAISHQIINREQLMLATTASSGLNKKKKIMLKDLVELPFVWIKRKESPQYYDMILAQCDRAGVTLHVLQEANTESAILSLVSAEIGSSFITEAALKRRPENVILLPVKDLDCELKLMAIWRKNDNNPVLKHFVGMFKAGKGE
jgi:DNA-binding transcriptional LysR family regulator